MLLIFSCIFIILTETSPVRAVNIGMGYYTSSQLDFSEFSYCNEDNPVFLFLLGSTRQSVLNFQLTYDHERVHSPHNYSPKEKFQNTAVSVLLKISDLHRAPFSPYFLIGPSINFSSWESSGWWSSKHTDLGVAAGFGIEFKIKNHFTVFADARVNWFDFKSSLTTRNYASSKWGFGISYVF